VKKLAVIGLMWVCSWPAIGSRCPELYLYFTQATLPTTMFLDETLRIPLRLDHYLLGGNKRWILPYGAKLEAMSSGCPLLEGEDSRSYQPAHCLMHLVIKGDSVKTVSGKVAYYINDTTHCRLETMLVAGTLNLSVIPRALSMSTIPTQKATANIKFNLNLKPYVLNFDQNTRANTPAQGIVSPIEQDGLRFDQSTFSIVGTPTRTGIYHFQVGAKNAYSETGKVDFNIEVKINPKDTPRFKNQHYLITAMPGQKYKMNLMELIVPQADFMVSNQILFSIDHDQPHPSWLHISSTDATLIEGEVPPDKAGHKFKITLIASSNTGGDSLPLVVEVPIAFDPLKRPIIEYFELEQQVFSNFQVNLSRFIKDPAKDSTLELVIDKIEPAVSWISVSSINSVALEGSVPKEAAGEVYQMTLHANTVTGGSSELITVPLRIQVNKERRPRFKEDNPILPLVYPNQPYFYDFVANRDIFPDYESAPYEISFAEEHEHPEWLRLEKNRLISDNVDKEISNRIKIYVVIKNKPGGVTQPIPLYLTAMN